MLILHIDGGRRWGGGQNQVRLLMRELAGRDVEQLCICPQGSPLERRLRAEHLPYQGIRWNGGADLRAAFTIYRRSRDVTIIHCHDAHALQLAVLPARFRGIPLVATRRVHFPANARVWNRPDRVIAITEAVKARLLECGIDEARIRVIPSGIDVEEVRGLEAASPGLRERLGIPADAFIAGTVGAMFVFKNQKLIPHAAAIERRITWVIVGDGPERPTIEAAVAAHGVQANVRLAGAPADARPYIREFDAFVFTSRGEALGTSLLDAMALDIPVIAPDDAGPGELLRPVHQKTGATLYPLDDATALADATRRLREEEGLRSGMIEAQRMRLDEFRIQRTARAMLALYRELAEIP